MQEMPQSLALDIPRLVFGAFAVVVCMFASHVNTRYNAFLISSHD